MYIYINDFPHFFFYYLLFYNVQTVIVSFPR